MRMPTGITGKIVEQENLGKINPEPYLVEAEKMKSGHHNPNEGLTIDQIFEKNINRRFHASETLDKMNQEEYFNFAESMHLVEKSQPIGQRAFLAESLFQKLKRQFPNNRLEYFTAVGSCLDVKHGIDAYFKLYDNLNQEVGLVAFDLTTNRDKRSYKSLILPLPSGGLDPIDDYEEYQKMVNELYGLVLEKLQADFNDRKIVHRN